MVGITLSPEQIRGAPPEVRRWLEQQVVAALGLQRPPPVMEPPKHLVACGLDELREVLRLVQHIVPAVTVLFELAREPASVTSQGVRVLHLDEMMRHCRLQSPSQVVACLGALDEALRRGFGDQDAVLTVVDSNEHVLLPDMTARSIHALWQELVRPHAVAEATTPPADQPAPVNAGQPFQPPYAINVSSPAMPGGLPSV